MPRSSRAPLLIVLLFCLAGLLWPAATVPAVGQEPFDPDAYFAPMRWRNIGPTRGGRSVAVTGVVGEPLTYYFGGTGGGVWKTEDGGASWHNVSDGFFGTGSVGAIAVAESDPNVVYVGMGEHAVRGVTTSHGDGVYRSTDGGRTWTHVGLERTRAISRIRVHPRDPDLVYVAAQGAPYGPTQERGIYRSRDGGATWERVHFVNERAGASDLAMDMTNPRILYAAYWDHLRRPWIVESGGSGSGIYKSTDGGDTWRPINDGLPEPRGKIGVDVSRADPDRVYAIVEAEPGEGGLYRSDDAGEHWRLVNGERVLQARSWYYMEVFADPQDADTVYVMNAPFLRSIDGGRTFERVPVPHGDNHDLWINPRDARNMINANDGGANVTFDGGRSWSTQRNQPTAQFYRVITDNRFPYHVYGGQQDNSAIGIPSAAFGGIGWSDFYSVSGCESAYIAFDDEDDPQRVYGTCIEGDIDVWERDSGETKPIRPYPELNLGVNPIDQRYRFNWNNPVIHSRHAEGVIYQAGNVLFRSDDGGQSWRAVSPDLTRNDPEKQQVGGGPITNENAGGEVYNTIFYVIESPVAAGTIWAGTDDGLVHLTRDGGATWQEVTPPQVERLGRGGGPAPGEALINSIEASPHDPARAYVAVSRYKFNDFTPYAYRTDDYGRTWTPITEGIAPEHWLRVIREDPAVPGLLYAGTELGMYISFDDGAHWQPWQLNLPVVPVTDLTIRNGDLIASTQGRAFWILDDLSPVRQIARSGHPEHDLLLEPRTTTIVQWGGQQEGPGQNPPDGAVLWFHLREEPKEPVTLEIRDAAGELVRRFRSGAAEGEGGDDGEGAGGAGVASRGDDRAEALEAHEGLNRVVWDFRHAPVTGVPGVQNYGSLDGRIVPPGAYTVRLTVGEEAQEAELLLVQPPWREATAEQYREQDVFLARAAELLEEMHTSVNRLHGARGQLERLVERLERAGGHEELVAAARDLADRLEAWDGTIVQRAQETFQDVINFPNRLSAQVLALVGSVDGTEPPLTAGARERLADLQQQWRERAAARDALEAEIESFNARLREAGVGGVILPPAKEER